MPVRSQVMVPPLDEHEESDPEFSVVPVGSGALATYPPTASEGPVLVTVIV
jgi:hypothetical protein